MSGVEKQALKDVYTKEIVRKAILRDGKSKRQVAKELGIHRNTITRLLKMENQEIPQFQRKKWKNPVLGPYIPIIETWLKQDETAPKKQRHTATRIYERLREEYDFTGGKRTIQQYVSKVRQKPQEVALPLIFEPGEMAQVDWGEVWIYLGGVFQKVYIFVMTLNYSGGIYVEAFERMVQEAFFEGHNNAFCFFGGVPRAITYDNLKTAVEKILKGKNRIENERFSAFRSAWLFDSRFCNPGKGNEKGRVENMVKFAERNFFVPVPRVESLSELNILLHQRCLDYQGRTQERQTQSVEERMEEEKKYWLPIPIHPPECCRIIPVKTDKSSLVQFETNRYSLPSEYAYRSLWLKAFVDKVEITDQEKIIATHHRLKGRHQESIRFEHYRKLLERKPGGLQHLRAQEKEILPLKTREPGENPYPKTTVNPPDLNIYRKLRNQNHEPTTPNPDSGYLSQETQTAQCSGALSQVGCTSCAG